MMFSYVFLGADPKDNQIKPFIWQMKIKWMKQKK